MTKEFTYVMQLTGAAARGEDCTASPDKIDWQTVFSLAQKQQILPLICYALRKNPPAGCPNPLSTVLTYCARRGSVIALLEELEAAQHSCYVVKGFASAVHYAAPDYRICSDTDIVIDPSDEEIVCAFLKKHGFQISPRWEHGHHAIAVHPEMGILEVHVQLYDEIVGDVWFSGIDMHTLLQEEKERIETPDGTYWTLGPTDHAIFIALHLVKHFILSGASLRMMMDLALAISTEKHRLDMDRFWQILHTLHYRHLIEAILWATIDNCGFSAADFPGIGTRDSDCIALLLDDLEKGGWLGQDASEARKSCWYEYNRQLLMQRKNKLEYWLYMLNWNHSFRLTTLFPGKKRLAQDYPWVMKAPVLMPLAWLHRILFRGIAALCRGSWTRGITNAKKTQTDEEAARISLFYRLEML